MVASEATPYAKTGGLADVLGALPRALVRAGHAVDVVMPAYRNSPAPRPDETLHVAVGADVHATGVSVVTEGPLRMVFLHHEGCFGRDGLYGVRGVDYPDNPLRFALLARAAIDWAGRSAERYDIAHGHDWQAGLLPVLLRAGVGAGGPLGDAAVVHTIHNLAYQGLCDASWLPRLGLGWEWLTPDGLEFWGRVSFLKGGITCSDVVTTVSPRYATEIQTSEFGCGLDGLLRHRRDALVGILNGIDYDEWNPQTDHHLAAPFSAGALAGKAETKRHVLREFGFVPEPIMSRPLVGLVSRLVDQKGFDLIAGLTEQLPSLEATFVLLGTGERRYEDMWLALASRYPDRIAARIGFDEGLAHRVEGGADLFLMPSRFEPCGLNQMYSSRYGTLPLVRETGGLADTVQNYDPETGTGTGFVFKEYSPKALLGTLQWALSVYPKRAVWQGLQRAGMARDFSWDASAQEYVKVYERARLAHSARVVDSQVHGEQDGIRKGQDLHRR